MSRRFTSALIAVVVAACGGRDERPAGTGTGGGAGEGGGDTDGSCAPGEALYDQECWPAGLPPDWTTPGPTTEPTPGVPSDGCGEGFSADGLGGCDPILPPAPCTGTLMAVPGDTICRPIADCGTGPWGDIPVEGSTVYVDQAFNGAPDGSASAPYPTIQQGVDAASEGAVVAVAAGSYAEDVLISAKAVALWGRCPDMVAVQGQGGLGAIQINGAPGAEVHGLDVSGPTIGVAVVSSPDAWIDRVYAHETGLPGVAVLGQGEPVRLTASLVVDTSIAGVISQGQLVVESCEVRGTAAAPSMTGITSYPQMDEAVTLRVVGSLVSGATSVGLSLSDADVEVERSVIADTQPIDGNPGFGIYGTDERGVEGQLTMRRCVVSGNHEFNVVLAGASATIEDSTIEASVAGGTGIGGGLWVVDGVIGRMPSTMTITRSTVRNHQSVGVELTNGILQASGLLLQRVAPNAVTGSNGQGIRTTDEEGGAPSEILIEGSVIEDTHDGAVVAWHGLATLRESVIRGVTDPDDESVSVGVFAGLFSSSSLPAAVEVERCRVEDVEGVGLLAQGGSLTIRQTEVGEIAVSPGASQSGLAVGVFAENGDAMTDLVVDRCLLRDTASRGILARMARVEIDATLVQRTAKGDGLLLGTGRGIELQQSQGFVRWTEVGGVHTSGVIGFASDLSLEGVHVHDVATGIDGLEGGGLIIAAAEGITGSMSATGCRVERTRSIGVGADEASLVLERSVVTDVRSDDEANFGRGIVGQRAEALTVAGCRVEGTTEGGIYLVESPAQISDTTIGAVTAADDHGLFGDGLVAVLSTPVAARDVTVSDVARAAVSAFGTEMTVADTDLRCNALPLASETYEGQKSVLENLGGNRCGCEQEAVCKAVSTGLEPPEPLPPSGGQ